MAAPLIMVTGANGQLGREIRDLAGQYPHFRFLFLSHEDLAIEEPAGLQHFFDEHRPAYCINCAAYTAVDKAETDRDAAMQVNADAVGLLSASCALSGTRFTHISTDYVFDGNATTPYTEAATTNPVNYYGETKRKGETLALQHNPESIIIRTSWVYSAYGKNFVKTMLRLMKERSSLGVVNDQLGSPTYAADLGRAIMKMIVQGEDRPGGWQPGIYHYSNQGIISWYDFAEAIKTLSGSSCSIQPIPTSAYPTPARRPAYSAFDTSRIQSVYGLSIPHWKTSLASAMKHMQP